MTHGQVFGAYFTEEQHAIVRDALEAYHDDLIQESPGCERERLVRRTLDIILMARFKPV